MLKEKDRKTSILTDDQIAEIKIRYKRWKKAKEKYLKVFNKDSPSALSKEFNVFPSKIYFVADKEYKEKYREENRLRYHKNKIKEIFSKLEKMKG